MTTKKIQLIETTENGAVLVHEITRYFDTDGVFLTENNWRTTLEPTKDESSLLEINELLTEVNFNIVKLIWTDDIVNKYLELYK